MDQIGYGQYTPHGFLASYWTWAAACGAMATLSIVA